ncbi:MAG: calcium-binding protein [Quinella sp. 3Q1]|nr:calcium-binding protein [Quinella sp. 3Q1]
MVKGAKSKSGLSVSGKRITLKNSALNKKVTVSGSGYEFDFAADYKNATITGSGSDDTIIARGSKVLVNGGKGDDTIKILGAGTVKGGAGADVFYYKSSGANVLSDYAEEDTISIASGKAATSTSGDDLILKAGKGKVTIVGGRSKTVTYIDADGEHTYEDTSDGVKFNAAGTGVTLTAGYSEDVFDLADYPDYKNKVITINAAKIKHSLEITGNKNANKITGTSEDDSIDGGAGADLIKSGAGNDTLWGNKGNDTLYGGAGDDIFLYKNVDGNDVIADFELGDKIQVISADIGFPTATAKGEVTFTVGSGKLVIKGGADKYIQLYGENGGELAQRYTP